MIFWTLFVGCFLFLLSTEGSIESSKKRKVFEIPEHQQRLIHECDRLFPSRDKRLKLETHDGRSNVINSCMAHIKAIQNQDTENYVLYQYKLLYTALNHPNEKYAEKYFNFPTEIWQDYSSIIKNQLKMSNEENQLLQRIVLWLSYSYKKLRSVLDTTCITNYFSLRPLKESLAMICSQSIMIFRRNILKQDVNHRFDVRPEQFKTIVFYMKPYLYSATIEMVCLQLTKAIDNNGSSKFLSQILYMAKSFIFLEHPHDLGSCIYGTKISKDGYTKTTFDGLLAFNNALKRFNTNGQAYKFFTHLKRHRFSTIKDEDVERPFILIAWLQDTIIRLEEVLLRVQSNSDDCIMIQNLISTAIDLRNVVFAETFVAVKPSTDSTQVEQTVPKNAIHQVIHNSERTLDVATKNFRTSEGHHVEFGKSALSITSIPFFNDVGISSNNFDVWRDDYMSLEPKSVENQQNPANIEEFPNLFN